jgi:hypothetical protein
MFPTILLGLDVVKGLESRLMFFDYCASFGRPYNRLNFAALTPIVTVLDKNLRDFVGLSVIGFDIFSLKYGALFQEKVALFSQGGTTH